MWYELFSIIYTIFLVSVAYFVGFLISYAIADTFFFNKTYLIVIPLVLIEGFITLGLLAFLELGGMI